MNLRLTKFVIRLLAFAICVMSGLTPAMAQRSAVPTLVAPTPKSGGTPFARPTKGGGQVSGPLVTKILVEGAQRIEAETVRSYMVQKQGETFDPLKINQSLKSLFATGLFSDVTIRRNGPALIVQVVENPIINRIAFEGNKEVEDENLSSEVQLRPRIVFTRKRGQRDVKRLVALFVPPIYTDAASLLSSMRPFAGLSPWKTELSFGGRKRLKERLARRSSS